MELSVLLIPCYEIVPLIEPCHVIEVVYTLIDIPNHISTS